MAQPPVRCTEFVDLVTDWMELALPDDARLQIEEHLAICPHCSTYVAQLRRSVELVRETPRAAPSAPIRASLLAAFRENS